MTELAEQARQEAERKASEDEDCEDRIINGKKMVVSVWEI